MNLDGILDDSEIERRLLVQFATDHERENLAFARTEGVKALAEYRQLRMFLRRALTDGQGIFDFADEFLFAKRLRQKARRAGFHGSNRHRNVSVSGNKDYREGNTSFQQ